MSQNLDHFDKNGFVILKNFIQDEDFNSICEKLKKDVLIEFNKLEKTGGSLMGNLNISPGSYSKIIFEKFNTKEFQNIIKEISKKNLSSFDIISGGNLNFQYNYNQHFHTDSKFDSSFLIINIVTEDISETNGPLEIIPGTQKNKLPYWKILFKKSLKIIAKRGDLIIRTSNLWHRGTINFSQNPRLLLAYILRNKLGDVGKLNFDNDKKLMILNNLFKPNLKGIIKENFYTRLSYIYKSYRLLRSFFTNKHFH
tara:strand:- start:308 stop:1069 length:762 start_codon:yes stop_codon:yes gene_type:complete